MRRASLLASDMRVWRVHWGFGPRHGQPCADLGRIGRIGHIGRIARPDASGPLSALIGAGGLPGLAQSRPQPAQGARPRPLFGPQPRLGAFAVNAVMPSCLGRRVLWLGSRPQEAKRPDRPPSWRVESAACASQHRQAGEKPVAGMGGHGRAWAGMGANGSVWSLDGLSRSNRKRLHRRPRPQGGMRPAPVVHAHPRRKVVGALAPRSRRSGRSPAPAQAVWMKRGDAVGPGRAGPGPECLAPQRWHVAANAREVQHGPLSAATLRTLTPRRWQQSADALRQPTALSWRSSGNRPPRGGPSPRRARCSPSLLGAAAPTGRSCASSSAPPKVAGKVRGMTMPVFPTRILMTR